MNEDCYAYVRQYYGVEAFIHRRVRLKEAEGRTGVLVRQRAGQGHYLYLKLDGQSSISGPYHPLDVDYLPVGV